ncbi:helix-turn-helix transcriptional regulator [Brenneria populi subsp. brevivirga]|uniref:helix-turn-helix transcriptional regulator n=1 Tax=Brenneria populi TaxID=1505588 RepID=UPI002E16F771|nr:helix-turn-helix transcriptional regulator [Brenneria populi subsp. brevivirga]
MCSKYNGNKELGAFLRLKREQMDPAFFGISVDSRRRTTGLRREEIAQLAHIGLSWYTWLEQGRPITVSSKILVKLSKLLNLEDEEIRYIFSLANRTVPGHLIKNCCVSPLVNNFLKSLHYSPAFVLDKYYNILLWNDAFNKVLFNIENTPANERNLVKIAFTNDDFKEKCVNREVVLRDILSHFRLACSQSDNDVGFDKIITELSLNSPLFNKYWSEHYIANTINRTKKIIHPTLGEMLFEHTSYYLADNINSQLLMYIETPVPGSETEKKIKEYIDGL